MEIALALVVAAIVLVTLLIVGVIPGLRPPTPGASPSAFATARAQAQSAADSYDGGNWTAIAASAVIPATVINYPLNGSPLAALLNGSGCTYTALAAGSESVAGSANVSQGGAGAWLFVFRNASDGLLLVSETPEAVTLVGAVAGGCTAIFGYANPIPTNVVDGSTAAQSADAGGGYAFLDAHPGANGSLTVFGGATIYGASSPAFWTVGYSDCPLQASPATMAAAFSANVSAVSGTLLTSRSYTASCPAVAGPARGGTSLAGDLELGPVRESRTSGAYVYTTAVLGADPPLAAVDLAVSVQTSTGQGLDLPAGSVLNLTSATGETLASCSLTAGTWATGATAAVTPGESFVLTTSTNLSGQSYVIVFDGAAGYTGSVLAGIP